MALEAVVCPPDRFTYGFKNIFPVAGGGGGAWGYDFCFQDEDKALPVILETNLQQQGSHATWDSSSTSVMQQQHAKELWDPYSSSPETCTVDQSLPGPAAGFQAPMEPPAAYTATNGGGRRKRRRTRSSKNKEELENQRMTHIAVERNRRKQMNEYLAAIRSLMPASYVQRVSFYFSLFRLD